MSNQPIILQCAAEEHYYDSSIVYWPYEQEMGEKLLRHLESTEGTTKHVKLICTLQMIPSGEIWKADECFVGYRAKLDAVFGQDAAKKLGLFAILGQEVELGELSPHLYFQACDAFC